MSATEATGSGSVFVSMARSAVELWVAEHQRLVVPQPLQAELVFAAACFVSIKIGKSLRGCIGTVQPEMPSLAQEIVHNAVAAASRDPRFYPVRMDELAKLDYGVDVLSELEPLESLDDQDPAQHGLIVEGRGRRGVLLPDLEGVDTAARQFEICISKAGLTPDQGISLSRFTVRRYH